MTERPARAVARTFVTSVMLGLGVLLAEPYVHGTVRVAVLAGLAVVYLSLLLYLWLATMPDPPPHHPSTVRAQAEARRRRRG
jgi:hypothetical protein